MTCNDRCVYNTFNYKRIVVGLFLIENRKSKKKYKYYLLPSYLENIRV